MGAFTSNRIFVLTVLMLFIVAFGDCQMRNDTQKMDPRPCVCKSCSDKSVDIECTNNKFSAREIQSFLNRTDPSGNLFELNLRFTSPSVTLPANLISGRRFVRIFIHCSNESVATKLKIDPNAFRTSSHHTDTLRVFNCDLSQQEDFSFLSDFEKLTSLSIQSSLHIENFSKLPLLPELKMLTIFNCTGLEKLDQFPANALSSRLKELDLALNSLKDETMERFLNTISLSRSAKTLEVLRLSDNRLTRIPDSKKLSSLTSLSQFFLNGNSISLIGKKSLEFCSQMPNLTVLNLMDMSLNIVERGAFDLVRAKVHLDVSNLTQFQSSVYKNMLENSIKNGRGGITFTSNLVDCSDCGLTWIIRDNRQLLKSVQGTCNRNASATSFQDLDEHDYDQCEASSGDEEDAQSSWLYYLLMKLVGVGF